MLLGAGCTSKAKARSKAQKAFLAGQNQAQQSKNREATITVVGQVRNPVVAWHEGITLIEAIDAAVYTGFNDPRLIRVVRGGEFLNVVPKDLLRGTVNPPLEAGDVIEIHR